MITSCTTVIRCIRIIHSFQCCYGNFYRLCKLCHFFYRQILIPAWVCLLLLLNGAFLFNYKKWESRRTEHRFYAKIVAVVTTLTTSRQINERDKVCRWFVAVRWRIFFGYTSLMPKTNDRLAIAGVLLNVARLRLFLFHLAGRQNYIGIYLRKLVSNTIPMSDDVSLVEQELLALKVHLSSLLVFSGVRVTQSVVFCVIFCRSIFVLSSYFLCCLSFFDLLGSSWWDKAMQHWPNLYITPIGLSRCHFPNNTIYCL
jgi:hypothetical protein